MVAKGAGVGGWIGSVGLADADYYRQDGSTTRAHCAAQGSPFSMVINHNGKEYEEDYIYICTTESLCCTPETNIIV